MDFSLRRKFSTFLEIRKNRRFFPCVFFENRLRFSPVLQVRDSNYLCLNVDTFLIIWSIPMANSKKTKPKKTATAVAKKKATAKKVAPKKGNASAKKKVEIIKKALSSSSIKPKLAKPAKKISGSLNPLGKKWTCHTCSTKFYDLNKEEKICPKCGADQNKRPVARTRTVRPRVVEEEEVIDDETLVEDEEMGFTEEPLEEALDEDGDDAEEPEE